MKQNLDGLSGNPIEITSAENLSAVLSQYGIPLDQWGNAGAKTVDQLFEEIEAGESALIIRDGKLLRSSANANIVVEYTDESGKKFTLSEDRQVLVNGMERKRPWIRSLAEKMKAGENPEETVKRGMAEELGIKEGIEITKENVEIAKKSSPSYPGLDSEYVVHLYKAVIGKDQFNPDGYQEVQKDKTTYFVWKASS